jgi:hypothetical protein
MRRPHGVDSGTLQADADTAVGQYSERRLSTEAPIMPTIMMKNGTEIYYKDWHSGQPIGLQPRWPLSADDWDVQQRCGVKYLKY